MILYHGSEKRIDKPIYRAGRRNNDYGYGFYCTEYPDIAREWAVAQDRDGVINAYELDISGLNVLRLDEYPILTWLAILLQNRYFTIDTPLAYEAKRYIISEFGIDYTGYDVIIGYRADDSYFTFAQDFLRNVISYEQLKKAMHLGELGEQVVLKSELAFSRIFFTSSEIVSREPWLNKKNERDIRARKSYFSMNRESYVPNSLYITQIIDKEIKKDDPRIR